MSSERKTVRVRIAVSVDPKGDWAACGFSGMKETSAHGYTIDTPETGEARYWLEADLPLPSVPVVRAEVKEVNDE